jgi:hypothetical protein
MSTSMKSCSLPRKSRKKFRGAFPLHFRSAILGVSIIPVPMLTDEALTNHDCLKDSSFDQPGPISIATPELSSVLVLSPSGYRPILLYELPWFQFQQTMESMKIRT